MDPNRDADTERVQAAHRAVAAALDARHRKIRRDMIRSWAFIGVSVAALVIGLTMALGLYKAEDRGTAETVAGIVAAVAGVLLGAIAGGIAQLSAMRQRRQAQVAMEFVLRVFEDSEHRIIEAAAQDGLADAQETEWAIARRQTSLSALAALDSAVRSSSDDSLSERAR